MYDWYVAAVEEDDSIDSPAALLPPICHIEAEHQACFIAVPGSALFGEPRLNQISSIRGGSAMMKFVSALVRIYVSPENSPRSFARPGAAITLLSRPYTVIKTGSGGRAYSCIARTISVLCCQTQ